MVSLRRRRLLGLCSGKSSIPVELPGSIENNGAISLNKNVNPFSIHPIRLISLHHENPTNIHETSFGSSIVAATSSPKEEIDNYSPGNDVKHRKRYRRKLYEDQEPCIMRGVYFKNMKWQAAIKVDKKQIHLGTVGSQEDAARLYDSSLYVHLPDENLLSTEQLLCVADNQTLSSQRRRSVSLAIITGKSSSQSHAMQLTIKSSKEGLEEEERNQG